MSRLVGLAAPGSPNAWEPASRTRSTACPRTRSGDYGAFVRLTRLAGELEAQAFGNPGVLPGIYEFYWPTADETPTNLRVPSPDGEEVYVFDLSGRHVETRNGWNNTPLLNFHHDSEGRLASIEDADGNFTTILRDGNGVLTGIRAPFGQVTALEENPDGYLRQIQPDPQQPPYILDYHSDEGLLGSMRNPRGELHQYEFTPDGELQTDVGPDGRTVTLTKQANTQIQDVQAVVTGEGTTHYVTDLADPAGPKKTITYPDGSSLVQQYHPTGEVERVAPDGTVTVTSEEPSGGYAALTPAVTTTTTLPSGLTRVDSYRRDVTVDPAAPQNILSWTAERTISGDVWTTVHDVATGIRVQTSPEGRTSTVVLDSTGRPVSLQRAGLAPVALSYDPNGRLATVDHGVGDVRRVSYGYYPANNPGAPESSGYLESITGPIPSETRQLTPDVMGRTLDLQTPDGEHTLMSYDPMGAIVSLTPPGRPAHQFGYTSTGHLDTYTAPPAQSGGVAPVEDHDYHTGWLHNTTTLPDGRTLTSAYDPQIPGRSVTLSTSDTTYGFSYDDVVAGGGTGQLLGIARDDGVSVRSLQLSHDGPLLSSVTWSHPGEVANGSVSFVHDSSLRVDQLLVNGQLVADYSYDRDGLLTGASALTVTPDAVTGLLSSTVLGDMSDSYAWTSFVELDLHESRHLGTLYYGEDVDETTRDARGRIRDVTEQVMSVPGNPLDQRTRGYEYDTASRLQYVFENGTQVSEYIYDENGSRTGHVQAAGTVVGHYDNQDRLTQYCPEDGSGAPATGLGLPCFSYAHNASGQLEAQTDLSSGEVRSFDYDEFGDLRGVMSSAGDDIEYELDAAGRRVGKRINGTAVRGWLYQDALNPVVELDGTGAMVSTFVYATMGHVPDYMVRAGVTYRIVTDHLGSVRLVVNVADGSVAQRLDYDEFGNVVLDTNPGFQPFGFAGGLYDTDTGLVRFGARDYDAVSGRWTAKDPILFTGGQTNLYVYVGNDPVNQIDPTGKLSSSCQACAACNTATNIAAARCIRIPEPRVRAACIAIAKSGCVVPCAACAAETIEDLLEPEPGDFPPPDPNMCEA